MKHLILNTSVTEFLQAKDERRIDVVSLAADAQVTLVLEHPCERALAFELLQLGDVIKFVLSHLNASKICSYLSEVSVKVMLLFEHFLLISSCNMDTHIVY